MRRPILVTGVHRSGTTWVGKMIAASPQVTYISEPLNVHHRPGVMRVPVGHWYKYICEDNQDEYLKPLQDTLEYRYRLGAEIRALKSAKDFGRMLRDLTWFMQGKFKSTRPLLKDPFAVFSIPWFVEQFNTQIIVLVRHPAGFVSSLKKLSWDFDFEDLLQQEYLMRDLLSDYKPEMEAVVKTNPNLIEQGALLWKIVYDIIDRYRQSIPGMIVLRHEAMAKEPEVEFRKLYDQLGMRFARKIEMIIDKSSSEKNPVELARGRQHSIQLHSEETIKNWKTRLLPGEIEKIYQITRPIADRYYHPGEWD